jgi:hypothetical protein
MSEKQNTKWYLNMLFWIGIVIGGILVTFVGFLPSIILLMQYNLEPNTIEDCKYGLTHTFYGQFCIKELELEKIGDVNYFGYDELGYDVTLNEQLSELKYLVDNHNGTFQVIFNDCTISSDDDYNLKIRDRASSVHCKSYNSDKIVDVWNLMNKTKITWCDSLSADGNTCLQQHNSESESRKK